VNPPFGREKAPSFMYAATGPELSALLGLGAAEHQVMLSADEVRGM